MNKKNVVGIVAVVACCLLVGFLLAGCSTPGSKKAPVTAGEIVQMSKSGTPAADIIEKIRESGTIYPMKASELASLKEQGVAAEVIDYMQQTYLRAIQSNQRLRDDYMGTYPDWSYDPFWYGPGEIGEHGEGSHHDRR